MERQYSPDGFERLKQDVKGVCSQYRLLLEQMGRLDFGQYEEFDKGDLLAKFTADFRAAGTRMQNFSTHLAKVGRDIEEEYAKGQSGIRQVEDVGSWTSAFGPSLPAAVVATYSGYACWQFANTGFSFSENFNDLGQFLNSDLYKAKNLLQTGYSMITNLPLWAGAVTGNMDGITGEWLEASMIGVLDGLAGGGGFTGFADWADDESGVKSLDGWLKTFADLAKKAALAGKSREEFLADAKLKELLKSVRGMDEETLGRYLDLFLDDEAWEGISKEISRLERIAEGGEAVGNFVDDLEWLDLAISGLSHALKDHTMQLQYLNSMELALKENGLVHGPVLETIEELKIQYASSSYNAGKALWNKAKAEVAKDTGKAVFGAIPGIREAHAVLSTGSGTIKLIAAKDIAADKMLMGLRQYDEALTRSYEGYIQKMKDNQATARDMEQADQLFDLLVATRKKEYECMIEIAGKGPAQAVYRSQLNKLNEAAREAKEASALANLDRFSDLMHATPDIDHQ